MLQQKDEGLISLIGERVFIKTAYSIYNGLLVDCNSVFATLKDYNIFHIGSNTIQIGDNEDNNNNNIYISCYHIESFKELN